MKQETTRELRQKLKDAQVLTDVRISQLIEVLSNPETSDQGKDAARQELREIREHTQATSLQGVKVVDGKLVKMKGTNNGQPTV